MKPAEKNHKQEVDRLVRIITDCYNIIPLTPGNSLAFGDCLLTPHIEKLVNAYDNVVRENARLVEERENPTNPHTQLALENSALRAELERMRMRLANAQSEIDLFRPYRIRHDDEVVTCSVRFSRREAEYHYDGLRGFIETITTKMTEDLYRTLMF